MGSRNHYYQKPRLVVGVPVATWNQLVGEYNLLVEYFRATKDIIKELKEEDEAAGLYPVKDNVTVESVTTWPHDQDS